jgi:hypothetical protein
VPDALLYGHGTFHVYKGMTMMMPEFIPFKERIRLRYGSGRNFAWDPLYYSLLTVIGQALLLILMFVLMLPCKYPGGYNKSQS